MNCLPIGLRKVGITVYNSYDLKVDSIRVMNLNLFQNPFTSSLIHYTNHSEIKNPTTKWNNTSLMLSWIYVNIKIVNWIQLLNCCYVLFQFYLNSFCLFFLSNKVQEYANTLYFCLMGDCAITFIKLDRVFISFQIYNH